MNSVFVSGIPTAGKTYLSRKLAAELGVQYLSTDEMRDELLQDPLLEPWVNFFWKKDEYEYYTTTSREERWKNLVDQSEAFWPTILKHVRNMEQAGTTFIIEGVNILPHLAARDFTFSGVYLLGESVEQIFERNKLSPRWGKTEELQRMEAEAFFYGERVQYLAEAKRFGFKTFVDSAEAERELLNRIK